MHQSDADWVKRWNCNYSSGRFHNNFHKLHHTQSVQIFVWISLYIFSLQTVYQERVMALPKQTKHRHYHNFLQYVKYEVILNNEACSLESARFQCSFITNEVL